jgi:hypothetical protein
MSTPVGMNAPFGPENDASVGVEVRNTYGGNMSFKKKVLDELDGFSPEMGGRRGDKNLQGEETELAARAQSRYGTGMYYTPDATVAHKIYDYRTDLSWLLNRAFWQGYSIRGMEVLVPDSSGAESDFLRQIVTDHTPRRLREIAASQSLSDIGQLLALYVLTAVVGIGYLYGLINYPPGRSDDDQ